MKHIPNSPFFLKKQILVFLARFLNAPFPNSASIVYCILAIIHLNISNRHNISSMFVYIFNPKLYRPKFSIVMDERGDKKNSIYWKVLLHSFTKQWIMDLGLKQGIKLE